MGRKKLTTEDIKERIYSLEGDNYELLSEYVGSLTKFKIKHNTCGCIFEVNWNNFQQGSRCPKCAGKYRYTDSEMSELVAEMTDGEYTKLSTYKNANTKFSIRHNKCGHEYEATWGNFQQGQRCPKCNGKHRYTDSEISKLVSDMTNGDYIKLSKYVNNKTKFKIRHEKCGHEYEIAWNTFQSGVRCPKCAGKHRYIDNEISELVAEMTDGEYIKLSEYKNNYTKFKIKHVACGCEYSVSWNSFQQGSRCPRCNQSKGEKFIEDYLTNQGVSFATQVRFDDCKYKNTLPFDFAILNSENEVVALLEFDGQQHFEPIEAWGGEENLKEVQLRDKIKDNYCKAHKIPLLRIRFDENIEEKLNLFLYKLKGPKRQREMEEALSTN